MDNTRHQIRHTNEFWDHFGVATDAPEPGDLLFTSRNGLRPTHMGIVLDDERYIDAPGVDDSMVAISGIRRAAIAPRPDGETQLYHVTPIGFKRPTVLLESGDGRFYQKPI